MARSDICSMSITRLASFLTLLIHVSTAGLLDPAIAEWLWPSSIVVGDYLYITGGEHFYQDGRETLDQNIGTYVVDLTRSWTNETLVPTGSITPVPSDMVPSRQSLLFYDQKQNTVNRWAGWPYFIDSYPSTVWSFEAGSSTIDWKQGPNTSTQGLAANSSGPFASAIAYSNSTFFALGGDFRPIISDTHITVLPGLVMQDLSSQSWSNVSTVINGYSRVRTQARAVIASDFGAKGYLVAVGGEQPVSQASVYQSGEGMVDMSDITLYDIDSGTWYVQKATGDVPPERSEFCAVGTASEDGTFELFVYGGFVNDDNAAARAGDQGYLNVYALSLPAFRWFKSNSTTTRRRAAHACNIVGNRQMMSIGGYSVNSAQRFGVEPDPWTGGVGIFDMTEFTWSARYDAEAASYDSPDQVKQYYASDYTEPTWVDSALASVFHYEVKETSNSTSSPASEHSGTPVGAIAGGVVGGVAVVVVLSALAFWNLRRRNRRHALIAKGEAYPRHAELTATATRHEVDGSMFKTATAELPSNSDTIAELPGDGEADSDRTRTNLHRPGFR